MKLDNEQYVTTQDMEEYFKYLLKTVAHLKFGKIEIDVVDGYPISVKETRSFRVKKL